LETQNHTEIALSKNKLYLMLSGALLFVSMGVWFVVNPPALKHGLFSNPVLIVVLGVVTIVFFGFLGFSILRKLPDNKPGLIINDEGILTIQVH
jgi:hypothetical protein